MRQPKGGCHSLIQYHARQIVSPAFHCLIIPPTHGVLFSWHLYPAIKFSLSTKRQLLGPGPTNARVGSLRSALASYLGILVPMYNVSDAPLKQSGT
jgi:hypothetical protein